MFVLMTIPWFFCIFNQNSIGVTNDIFFKWNLILDTELYYFFILSKFELKIEYSRAWIYENNFGCFMQMKILGYVSILSNKRTCVEHVFLNRIKKNYSILTYKGNSTAKYFTNEKRIENFTHANTQSKYFPLTRWKWVQVYCFIDESVTISRIPN